MSIQEKINNEIKLSMKEKNVDKLAALRSVKSAILLELTKDGKTNMSDEIAIQIISKLVKQRKESASIFKSSLQSGTTGFLKRAFSTPIKKTNLFS